MNKIESNNEMFWEKHHVNNNRDSDLINNKHKKYLHLLLA